MLGSNWRLLDVRSRAELSHLALFSIPSLCIARRNPFRGYVGPFFRELAIQSQPALEPWLGIRLDRMRRTFRIAYSTIDAFVRMNNEHVLPCVEAIHWTYFHAVHVFALYAIIGDDIRHFGCSVGSAAVVASPTRLVVRGTAESDAVSDPSATPDRRSPRVLNGRGRRETLRAP